MNQVAKEERKNEPFSHHLLHVIICKLLSLQGNLQSSLIYVYVEVSPPDRLVTCNWALIVKDGEIYSVEAVREGRTYLILSPPSFSPFGITSSKSLVWQLNRTYTQGSADKDLQTPMCIFQQEISTGFSCSAVWMLISQLTTVWICILDPIHEQSSLIHYEHPTWTIIMDQKQCKNWGMLQCAAMCKPLLCKCLRIWGPKWKYFVDPQVQSQSL